MSHKPERARLVATIECRMTSSRLPGKVLLQACGKSMLELMVERVRLVPEIDTIVLATTNNAADDDIERLAERLEIGIFRGSEDDVLSRVLGAAQKYEAPVIVELTGDCPLSDPDVISQGISTYFANKCDYLSNVHVPGYPIGFDVQVFATDLLAVADREGHLPEDREHVSWFFRRQPERFRTIHLAPPAWLYDPDLRLTLDERDDYLLIKRIFEELYEANPRFAAREILAFLRANPEISKLNAHVLQKEIAQGT